MINVNTSTSAVTDLVQELRLKSRKNSVSHKAADILLTLMVERDVARATLELYRAETGCTRNQRTTQWCGEVVHLRSEFLRYVQRENTCDATGNPCAEKCGCRDELEEAINSNR